MINKKNTCYRTLVKMDMFISKKKSISQFELFEKPRILVVFELNIFHKLQRKMIFTSKGLSFVEFFFVAHFPFQKNLLHQKINKLYC